MGGPGDPGPIPREINKVSLPPYTVAWLEAHRRAIPGRVLDTVSGVIERIRARR